MSGALVARCREGGSWSGEKRGVGAGEEVRVWRGQARWIRRI